MTQQPPSHLQKFIDEYVRLASLPELSDKDADRMAAILELAQYDSELNDWINQVDQQVNSQDVN
jgi:hypothetical protein